MNVPDILQTLQPLSGVFSLIAGNAGEMLHDWPTVGQTLWFVFGCTFFLLLNAFFVASEFAIVKVRRSQIDIAEGKSKRNTATAKKVVDNLDAYLSANQLGITIASLALGLLAEPFIDSLLKYILLNRFDVWFQWDLSPYADRINYLSYGVALAFFTILHVVIGELIPKGIAIRKPLQVTLLIVRPLHWFYVSFSWLIRLLNHFSNLILKNLFHIDPLNEGEHAHSSEELALLVEESEKKSEVTEKEREILINALELNDVTVKDVMTPRSEVVVLDVDANFATNLDIATRSKHTRFPLVKGHLDHAMGLIHIKDILTMLHDDDPDLFSIKRSLKVVPETMPLDVLLQFFLKEHAHLALAVDEHGDPAGLVFLDNVIEELVGDIQDEFDNERSAFSQINEREFVVEGGMTLNELSDHVPELDLESGEVSTVGGYITRELGRIPEPGESHEIIGYEAKVMNTDGRRVGQVHFRRLKKVTKELDPQLNAGEI
ncbi:hemolysin family protein [Oceaniferula marina]|nr:hemolysin family protein [Oceaniferula marina]